MRPAPRIPASMLPALPVALLTLGCAGERHEAQRADEQYAAPAVVEPAHVAGSRPRVAIDEAHHNYHTADGRYRAFARTLEQDGYRVDRFVSEFTTGALGECDVLVISNALAAGADMTYPNESAFTPAEIEAVRDWVHDGGRLMLIADHMPMPGAAAGLGRAFGVRFHDGFAFLPGDRTWMTFRRRDGTLADHRVTREEGGGEVPFVMTFAGQAFEFLPGADGEPLLILQDDAFLRFPEKAWEFTAKTPKKPAGRMLQGALLRRGRGRVAVFGEAAAFTAQLGPNARPTGMNHPDAPHNARFLRNVMRWLTER